MKPHEKIGPITYLTVALLASFGLADAYAKASGYAQGETFSHWSTARIRALPTWARILVRVLVLGFALSLGPHIAFGTVLLP